MTRPGYIDKFLVQFFNDWHIFEELKIYFGHIYLSTFLNLTAHFDLYFFEGAPFHLDLEVVYIFQFYCNFAIEFIPYTNASTTYFF